MELAEKIINYFFILKEKKIVGSSYLFIGDNFPLIWRLLKLVNCQKAQGYCNNCWSCRQIDAGKHPDLLVIEPEGLSIKIEAMRPAIKFLSLRSYYSPKKILLIKNADKLTSESANLFLKTLEEPPSNCFIGLCLSKLEDILPTLASRCRKIYLPYSQKIPKIVFKQQNRPASFFPKAADFKKRKDFALFLESLIVSLHSQLKSSLEKKSSQVAAGLFFGLGPGQLIETMENVFKIYRAHNTVNMNLALNSIKMGLK